MDIRRRRRLSAIGIDLLMETVEDALHEAYENDEGGLAATTVAPKAGLPSEGYSGRLSRYVLNRLEIDGIAINDQPGPGHGSWRLDD